jgi:hypothetical protein
VSDRRSEQCRIASEALASCASRIEVSGARGWRITLGEFPEGIVDVCIHDDWLDLSVHVSREPFGAPAEFLRRNGALHGGVKLALHGGPGESELRLCAEVPFDDPEPIVHRRVVQACAGFAGAFKPTPARDDPAAGNPGEAADLGILLEQSEWVASERPDGSLTVDLGVSDDFFQAHIARCNGATRVAVEVGNLDAAPEVCRRAAALLLLRSAAVVRMARPVRDDDGTVRFEVVFDAVPSAAELSHALSALTVACRFFGREVDLILRSEPMAVHYCAAHGRGGAEAVLAETG